MTPPPLVCPSCGTPHPGDQRFCADCGMPLVVAGGPVRLDERRERARKIDPRYADGPLVWAAGARNQVEAEFLAGMLLEEGVPSLVRRAPGFDVPDFVASGAREILVPASGAAAAREILAGTPAAAAAAAASPRSPLPRSTRAMAWLLLAVALIAIVLFMATHTWD